MIKVLVISPRYPPHYSGAGLRAHRTYKRLQRDYKVKPLVITTKTNYNNVYDNYEGIEVYRIHDIRGIVPNIIVLIKLLLREDMQTYRVVHCFGTGFLNVAAAICAIIFSKKLIIEKTVNELLIDDGFLSKIRDIFTFLRIKLFQRITQRKADLLVAINETIRNEYLRIGIPDKKIWTRPNPVDTREFYFPSLVERQKARKTLRIDDKQFVHLMIGDICPRKNQFFAIEYFKLLPENHRLLIVGPAFHNQAHYLKKIEHYIKSNHLNDKVTILTGFQTDIIQFFHASDIFILPSTNEGMPNVLLEALCCGLPALVNKELNLAYIVTDGINGMNLPLDPVKFVKYAQNYEQLEQDRENIAQISRKKFGSDLLDDKFVKRLSNLLYSN